MRITQNGLTSVRHFQIFVIPNEVRNLSGFKIRKREIPHFVGNDKINWYSANFEGLPTPIIEK
jgi:hypothetical protein